MFGTCLRCEALTVKLVRSGVCPIRDQPKAVRTKHLRPACPRVAGRCEDARIVRCKKVYCIAPKVLLCKRQVKVKSRARASKPCTPVPVKTAKPTPDRGQGRGVRPEDDCRARGHDPDHQAEIQDPTVRRLPGVEAP